MYAASLTDPSSPVPIVVASSGAIYAPPFNGSPGHLIWVNGDALIAQPFNAEALKLEGEPQVLASPAGFSLASQVPATISNNGLLLHLPESAGARLAWLDRDGKPVGEGGEADRIVLARLSPDRKRALLVRRAGAAGLTIWMREFERDAWTQFSLLPRFHARPIWSADGRTALYYVGSPSGIVRKALNGEGGEQQAIKSTGNVQLPSDWSRDGRVLLYSEAHPQSKGDLWFTGTKLRQTEPPIPPLRPHLI